MIANFHGRASKHGIINWSIGYQGVYSCKPIYREPQNPRTKSRNDSPQLRNIHEVFVRLTAAHAALPLLPLRLSLLELFLLGQIDLLQHRYALVFVSVYGFVETIVRLQECTRRMLILVLSIMPPEFWLINIEIRETEEDASLVDCVSRDILIVVTDSCRGEKSASNKISFRKGTDSSNQASSQSTFATREHLRLAFIHNILIQVSNGPRDIGSGGLNKLQACQVLRIFASNDSSIG